MNLFPPMPFDRMNEQDVREEIVAPIVRLLGYQTGTAFDVIRETSLRYPRVFMGRKNPTRDPELSGRADYILDVGGHARWVIEAKAPGVKIDIDVIEQAWTYANHAEVRAVYFAICNGKELRIFATHAAPSQRHILAIAYDELVATFSQIESILGPNAIAQDFPNQLAATGQPLGFGLRAIARVSRGIISYRKSNLSIALLGEMEVPIVDGVLERDEQGTLVVYLCTPSPFRTIQEFVVSLGLDRFEMRSNDTELSPDSNRPTEFVHHSSATFPKGAELLDINTMKKVKLPMTLQCHVTARAVGSLNDRTLNGLFSVNARLDLLGAPPIDVEGNFFVRFTR